MINKRCNRSRDIIHRIFFTEFYISVGNESRVVIRAGSESIMLFFRKKSNCCCFGNEKMPFSPVQRLHLLTDFYASLHNVGVHV